MFRWLNNNNKGKSHPIPIQRPSKSQFHTRNIAGEILQLQFQCESETSSEGLISKLADLYTEAVAHYESIGDATFLLYQKRLQSFLKKQQIREVLQGKSASLANRKDAAEKEILTARIRSRGEVAQILERLEKVERNNWTKLCQNLNEQERRLHQRIQKRRAVSTCSTRTKDEEDEVLPLGKGGRRVMI